MRMNKKILMMAGVAGLAVTAITGCTTNSHVGGLPLARMTFENYAPVILNVSRSTVTENYEIQNDPKDISSQFVMAPSEAVKAYASRRFPASGIGNGQFSIIIEDARVHLNEVKQDSKALSWANIGSEDIYRVFLRVRVVTQPDQTLSSSSTTIKNERTLVMKASASLAERERLQMEFLEKLIADVDKSIMTVLDQTPSLR
jgi:hypothetical protein